MKLTSRAIKTLVAIVLITSLVRASLVAGNVSDMRPALIGNGPKSLINLINGKHLIDRGVQHGALFFYAIVHPNGYPAYSKVWGMTKETEPLRDELRERLAEAKFIPAIYHGHPVYAGFYGTLTFSVIDGKPHVRIFANQELSELQKESDFIAPQAVYDPRHVYDQKETKEAFGGSMTQDKPGVADMSLTIDASGNVKDLHVASVTPAENRQYADAAADIMRRRIFLPAFRNGRPTDSTTDFKFYFIPAFYRLQ